MQLLGVPWGFERESSHPRMPATTPPEFNSRVQETFERIKDEVPIIRRHLEESTNYVWPTRQSASELKSLQVHTDKYFRPSTQAMAPDDDLKQAILYHAESNYGRARWKLPKNWWSHEAFLEAVRNLDMTSSPGIPYMKEAPTNGKWLKWDGILCDSLQLERLWYDVQKVKEPKFDLLLRVFIKQEPHKKRKAMEDRWRLIMAAPLSVQVAWQMCFRYMNDLEIEEAYHLPSQQGIVLVSGGWRQYQQQWKEQGQTCGMDKSAWDWTAPRWALALDLEFRKRMCNQGMNIAWEQISALLYHQMFDNPILVLSDGTAYRQVVPGVMKSGCVNTISTNSHCQVFIHIAVALTFKIPLKPLPRCVGDDTLCTQEQSPGGIISHYDTFGVILKSISDTLEFVGREFTDDGPIPMYIGKHVVKAQHVKEKDLPMYLDSMAREYCHSPEYFEVWKRLAECLDYPLPLSREAYLYWYDFPED